MLRSLALLPPKKKTRRGKFRVTFRKVICVQHRHSVLPLTTSKMLSTARRSVLSQNLRCCSASVASTSAARRLYSQKPPLEPGSDSKTKGQPGKAKEYEYKKPAPPPETWLASYLRRSPRAMTIFKSVTGVLGMGKDRKSVV